MTAKPNASVLALRAIIAVLLSRTALRICIAAVIILFIIAYISGYYAAKGSDLLWIITVLAVLLGILAAIAGFIIHFISLRLLPRKLVQSEKRFISSFSDNLFSKIGLVRSPPGAFVWGLLFELIWNKLKSPKTSAVKGMIDDSKQLSKDFAVIRGWFEK